ncbi:MAG: insulinase family protein [Phycisphaerales bacterium]|nr:insulinase family protein [Phycisphaerales bacterium]
MPSTITTLSVVLVCLGSLVTATPAFAQGAIPSRPESLNFPELKFTPPKASEYRTTLSDGTALYMFPSHEFPLITLTITCMGGSNLDPAGKEGLAWMTAAMIRQGGSTSRTASEVDERLDFMATNLGVNSSGWTSSATMDCLKSNFDESLAILVDLLRNPGFDAEKFKIAKGELLEGLKQRNDNAAAISAREWGYLVYGEDHFESAQPTGESVDSISTDDMRAMATRVFNPGNMIVSATGDFDPTTLPAALEKAFAGWQRGERIAPPSAPTHEMPAGVFYVEKDIPQGKVTIGMRSIMRDNPDFYAYTVMNEILGGGGFSSRITQKVRSDEGLAYSAGSGFRAGAFYPGVFRAAFESKNPTCALAAKIIFEELDRIRDTQVSASELDIAKNSFIETFPANFASKAGTLGVFVADEMTTRPAGYWDSYRDNIRAVTPDDIQRVAQKYLDPKSMTVLVVGKWSDISKGDLQGRATMSQIMPEDGLATQLPLRDPVSLKPLPIPPSGG